MSRTPTLLLLLTIAMGSAAAAAMEPAVARPSIADRQSDGRGLVFFVRHDAGGSGFAAVGTAHTFEFEHIAHSRGMVFSLAYSRQMVGSSRALLAPPGQPFSAPGARVRDDFLLYALEAPPKGVRVLELETARPAEPGDRVVLLGAPADTHHDEDDIFGRVVEATSDSLEVRLDVPFDLRGWGGAPVLAERTGRVVGLLEARSPRGPGPRVIVAPIHGVVKALAQPLGQGAGQSFASFLEGAEPEEVESIDTALRSPNRNEIYKVIQRRAGDLDQPLLDPGPHKRMRIQLDVVMPPEDTVVGDTACGVFVAGRALAYAGELKRFDVVIVLDTSASTMNPSGADIDGDGTVGQSRFGTLGAIFGSSTDSGDSILAAEVAAARRLLRGMDPRSTRVGIVTFAGDREENDQGAVFGRRGSPAAITVEPLGVDFARIEHALDRVLSDGPAGMTHMAAGVDQATIELLGLRGAQSKADPDSEKHVLFFTDGQPTLPYWGGYESENVRAVIRAADRSDRGNIVIHAFAIGPEALDGPIAVVEMARRTDGDFTPVRNPGQLVEAIDGVNFANLQQLVVRNKTNGKAADPFRAHADGSWGGFVALDPGDNRVEVLARAVDGTEARREILVRLDPKLEHPSVPPELVGKRNLLLEECLRGLRQVRMAAEQNRDEATRQELALEIEEEREKARERAEEQLKQLELGVEEGE